eukprot:14485544-Alexandrium_andersonii.AAC.1
MCIRDSHTFDALRGTAPQRAGGPSSPGGRGHLRGGEAHSPQSAAAPAPNNGRHCSHSRVGKAHSPRKKLENPAARAPA